MHMPTYEYKCKDCGKEFEVFKSIKDESLPACPECNSHNTSRLISATSFILKGSGWYMTDYGNKHSPSSNPAPKDETGTTDKPKESKPAEKPAKESKAESKTA